MFDDNGRSHCKRKIEFCERKAFYFSSQFKKRYPVQKNGAEKKCSRAQDKLMVTSTLALTEK